ncbi:hypothetical protein C8Q74DRAFT_1220732 [Fomes fomentarius]|nr:hypothetical protein C8Q74DRAFT_1220732 [Fomes fomentarius]
MPIPSVLVSNFKVSVLDDREMVGIENAEKLAWTASQVALVEVTSAFVSLCSCLWTSSLTSSLDGLIICEGLRNGNWHYRLASSRDTFQPLIAKTLNSSFTLDHSSSFGPVKSNHRVNHRDGTGRGALRMFHIRFRSFDEFVEFTSAWWIASGASRNFCKGLDAAFKEVMDSFPIEGNQDQVVDGNLALVSVAKGDVSLFPSTSFRLALSGLFPSTLSPMPITVDIATLVAFFSITGVFLLYARVLRREYLEDVRRAGHNRPLEHVPSTPANRSRSLPTIDSEEWEEAGVVDEALSNNHGAPCSSMPCWFSGPSSESVYQPWTRTPRTIRQRHRGDTEDGKKRLRRRSQLANDVCLCRRGDCSGLDNEECVPDVASSSRVQRRLVPVPIRSVVLTFAVNSTPSLRSTRSAAVGEGNDFNGSLIKRNVTLASRPPHRWSSHWTASNLVTGAVTDFGWPSREEQNSTWVSDSRFMAICREERKIGIPANIEVIGPMFDCVIRRMGSGTRTVQRGATFSTKACEKTLLCLHSEGDQHIGSLIVRPAESLQEWYRGLPRRTMPSLLERPSERRRSSSRLPAVPVAPPPHPSVHQAPRQCVTTYFRSYGNAVITQPYPVVDSVLETSTSI